MPTYKELKLQSSAIHEAKGNAVPAAEPTAAEVSA